MSLRILDLADKIKLKFRQLPVGKNNTLENYPSEALNKAFDTISKPEFAPDTLVTTNLASLFKQTTAGIGQGIKPSVTRAVTLLATEIITNLTFHKTISLLGWASEYGATEVAGYFSQNNNTQAKFTERLSHLINSIWSDAE